MATATEAAETGVVDAQGTPIGRRVVLAMLGLGGAGVLFGKRIQDGLSSALSPNVAALLPSGGRFRIYTVTGFLPRKATTEYRFQLDGLVDRPLDLGFDDLVSRPATSVEKDFQCVTGWRVPKVGWKGVLLRDLLDEAGVTPGSGAAAVRLHSFDGVYTESLTLEQARRSDALIAYEMEGKPVSRAHGGPVRLLMSAMYGYKSIKWLSRVEVVNRVVPGFWEERGYDVDAWVGSSNGRSDAPTS